VPPKRSVFDHRFQQFILGQVINLSEDTAIFRFLLHSPEDVFNLPACSTLQASFKEGSARIDQPMRFYTPITPSGTKGYFDLIVRRYDNGRFTEHLFGMEIGEPLLFRVLQYKLNYKPNKWQHIGLIGGGTGITPLLQVLQASFQHPEDRTKLSLLYAARSESKILLRGLLNEMEAEHSDRFKIYYTVDKPENPSEWKGFTGRISEETLKITMPPPRKGNLVLVCGPDKMLFAVCGSPWAVLKSMSGGAVVQPAGVNLNNFQDVGGLLARLGYTKEIVYRF
jgi:cytochrome-b5 reductase